MKKDRLTFNGLFRLSMLVYMFLMGVPICNSALQTNLLFIRVYQAFVPPSTPLEDRIARLREIQKMKAEAALPLLTRQVTMLSAIDQILEEVTQDNAQLGKHVDFFGVDWETYRLPTAVLIGPGWYLDSAVVVSEDADFAFGIPLKVALLLRPEDAQRATEAMHVDMAGWTVSSQSGRVVASGPVVNLVENSGFERPALDTRVPGVLNPAIWGGGPDSWQGIRLKEIDGGVLGQSACVMGKTRFSVPFKYVKGGTLLMFGAMFQTLYGSETIPYLIALSPGEESVKLISAVNVVNKMPSSNWRSGYGVVRIPEDLKVSLFLEAGDPENETCIDNLFIVSLPL